jgi:hypothetical protein
MCVTYQTNNSEFRCDRLWLTVDGVSIGFMGSGFIRPTQRDLFSTTANREDSSSSPRSLPTAGPETDTPRHVLPKNLPNSIKTLTDQELDQLHAAVLIERQRRGKKPPLNENARKPQVQEVSVPMSTGKINAVRAAFKAGVKPSQIARQFGISQADVRKALAGG